MAQITIAQRVTRQNVAESTVITIQPGEVRTLHLYEGFKSIRVVSGCAWISYAGVDSVLERGDKFYFSGERDFAVITAEQCHVLTYELRKD